MELNPAFLQANSEWNILSLGEYLSQLETADKNSFNQLFLQNELEVAIMQTLLNADGGTLRTELLPIVGEGSVSGAIAKISHSVSNYFTKCILTEEIDKDEIKDTLTFDLSLLEIISMININKKFNPSSTNKSTT